LPKRKIKSYKRDAEKPSPLRGEGKGEGAKPPEMPFLPLTPALSPKGRGEITFARTGIIKEGT
jgi:hypothetical protein